MAKKEVLTTEELEKQKREKDRKDKEEREKKIIEDKRKEKDAKRKRIEKRQKKQQKQEMARIKKIIEFPFKTLFQVSSLITFVYFIIYFFGREEILYKAVYNSFIVFISLYLGLGIIIVAIFLVISEKKEKELEEELNLIYEEKKRIEDAKLNEMKQMEDEIKSANKKSTKGKQMIGNIDIDAQLMPEMGFDTLPDSENEHFEDLGDLEAMDELKILNKSDKFNDVEFNEDDDYSSILSDRK